MTKKSVAGANGRRMGAIKKGFSKMAGIKKGFGKMGDVSMKAASKKGILEEHKPIAFLQHNTRKPNTASWVRFQRYCGARTLHEAKALGARPEDIRNDRSKGVLHQGDSLLKMGIPTAVRLYAPADDEPIAFAPNPKDPGSNAWARYERYQSAQTLKEAKGRGIWPGDIRNDIGKGFLGTKATPWASMGVRPSRKAGCGTSASKRTATKKSAAAGKDLRRVPKSVVRGASGRRSPGTGKATGPKMPNLAWSRKRGWA